MPIFRYEVTDLTGKTLRGAMDAATPADVERMLTARGYKNVHVIPPMGATVPGAAPVMAAVPSPQGFVFGGVKPADLATFFRQMASLMHSGFTVGSALTDLGRRSGPTKLRSAASAMGAAVAGGASLAAQMAEHPSIFPHHLIALAAAGERGGFMEFTFEESALWAEQEEALQRGNWINQLLIWQSVWSALIFAPLFPSIDYNNFMAGVSRYFTTIFLVCVPIGLLMHALQFFTRWLKRQPAWRRTFENLALRSPVAAKYAHMQGMAAFTRVLRRLLKSGVAPEIAFSGAANAVPNGVLRDRLMAGVATLRAGHGLDAAVQATGMMDNDPLNLLITGQKTGQWEEMLEQVTGYYQDEAARALEAVKSAQRRFGWLLTIISTGYVTIGLIYGLSTMGFRLVESWDKGQ